MTSFPELKGIKPEDLLEEDIEKISKFLVQISHRDKAARISLDSKLDTLHQLAYIGAINNILATDLAIFTYAQIIDGLPIADVGFDRNIPNLLAAHPLETHEKLCPGCMEKAKEICGRWNTNILSFDPKLVNAYQNSIHGSKAFKTRLIELVSVTLHQFRVILSQLSFLLHQGDLESIEKWQMPVSEYSPNPLPPPASIFSHSAFSHHKLYPDGVHDMAGYWAEDRILGGVAIFNRLEEQKSPNAPPNIFFLASRADVTKLAFQLTDKQQDSLLNFLLSGQQDKKSDSQLDDGLEPKHHVLPILGDQSNTLRIPMSETIYFHGICRDPWERKPYTTDAVYTLRRRPKSEIDYPEGRLLLYQVNKLLGLPLPIVDEADGESLEAMLISETIDETPKQTDNAKDNTSEGKEEG